MPSIICVPNDSTLIELNEFIEIIEENKYRLDDDNDVLMSAKQLNKLYNNRSFLINHIASELVNISNFQKSNVYDHKTFVLHQTKNFLLRAVVWSPLSQSTNKDNIFDIYHDHNFDLLTIGYFGPGYKTKAFTYNSNEVLGLIGEKVNVEDKGIFTLSQGQIMLYKAKKDIHNQIPPESISVSLNVIPVKGIINRPQFEFDKNDFTICRYIQVSSNELVTRLVGILGDENDIEVLKTVFLKHDNPHLKAYAAAAITQISPALHDMVKEWVDCLKNKVIIDLFDKETNKYGSCI